MGKKALVVSGGGSLGAWGAGIAKGLHDFHGKDYDLYVGTSTGSLMTPLIAAKQFDDLKEAYTSVNSKSIFRVDPFNKKGKPRILNAIWRLITGKTSIGDSSRLSCLIDEFVTEETYQAIKDANKTVAASVVNLTTDKIEYYSTDDSSLSEYKIWMEASASAPIIMNLIDVNGEKYTDGGIIDSIPVEYAIREGYTEIDVIAHKVPDHKLPKTKNKIKNLFHMIERIFVILFGNVWRDDIKVSSTVDALREEVTINYYYMPYKLTDNSLTFDQAQMKRWFDIGYLSMNRKDRYNDIITSVKLQPQKSDVPNDKSYFREEDQP